MTAWLTREPLSIRLMSDILPSNGYWAAVTAMATEKSSSESFASMQLRAGALPADSHSPHTPSICWKLRMSVSHTVADRILDLSLRAPRSSSSMPVRTLRVCSRTEPPGDTTPETCTTPAWMATWLRCGPAPMRSTSAMVPSCPCRPSAGGNDADLHGVLRRSELRLHDDSRGSVSWRHPLDPRAVHFIQAPQIREPHPGGKHPGLVGSRGRQQRVDSSQDAAGLLGDGRAGRVRGDLARQVHDAAVDHRLAHTGARFQPHDVRHDSPPQRASGSPRALTRARTCGSGSRAFAGGRMSVASRSISADGNERSGSRRTRYSLIGSATAW